MKINEINVKTNLKKREKIIYIVIVIICIIAIIAAIYAQFVRKEDLGIYISKDNSSAKEEEEYTLLKDEFDNIFDNLENITSIQLEKNYEDKNLVFTVYQNVQKTDKYDFSINIPSVNINDQSVLEFNNELDNFKSKALSIVENNVSDVIYTVEYCATVADDILSVIVRSDLKEGTSAQRVIIETLNYDLQTKKKLTLEEVLNKKQISIDNAQDKILEQIKIEEKKANNLRDLNYNILARDSESDIYKIENTNEFFVHNGNLYVIYPYGNDNLTSEMDLVIF